ncbi:MAG: PAS domain S-box protein [Phycisphaerales bacterium]|nr:MAG: PAS domain S-box protein [Phycisphaerales bacterium]
MRDESKSKAELLEEVKRLRERVASLEQAQKTGQEPDETWHSLVENAPDVIVITDADGTISYINHTISGATPQSIIGTRIYDYVLAEHHDKLRESLGRVFEFGEINCVEVLGIAMDSTRLWCDCRIGPVKRNGRIVAATIVVTDISERKRTEEALRRNEEQYRSVVEDSPGLVCRFLPDATIVFVNTAYCEYFGTNREELIGKKFTSLVPEEDRQAVLDRILALSVDSPSMTHEHRVTGRDGQIRWQRWTNRALFDDQGRAVIFQSFGEDITDRKEAEDALKQSEEKFRLAMETTNDALWDWDMVTNEVYRNPRHATMLGYEPGELSASQQEWEKRIHPEDKPSVFEAVKAHSDGTIPSFNIEYRLATKSGDYIWVLGRGKVVAYSNDGAPVRMLGTNVDITEKKKAETELRNSKNLLEKIFDGLDSAIFVLDHEMPPHIIDCNCSAVDVFGYAKSDLLGRTTDCLHVNKETLLEFQNKLFSAIKERGHLSSFEFRMKRRNGEIFPSEHAVFPLQNDDGDRIGWVSVIRDITERRKTLQTIRENQELIQGILDNTASVIVVRDTRGRYVMVNRQAQAVSGLDSCEIIGKTLFEIHTHAHAKKILADDKKVFESRAPLSIEDQLYIKDEMRTFLGTRFPLLNAAGEPYAICTVATDISERKKVEDALRESEERYRTLVESAGEAIATIDVNDVFTFINTTGARRLGAAPKDCVGKTMWDLFPKEVADRQMASVREVIATGRGANTVAPTELAGQVRWYNTTIEPLRDGAGEVNSAMIVARDIHELRQASAQIRVLSSAVEQSIDGIAIADLEPKLLYVNEAYARLHGYTCREMEGMNLVDLCCNESSGGCKRAIHQIRTQGSWTGEAEHVRKDGTVFPAHVSLTLLNDDDGEAAGTLALCRDMTEARQKEEELTRYRAQMARAEQLASLGTLSATVAHQVTQPLTVIRLSLDNALDELEGASGPHKVVRRLQDSVTQVSNITAIIDRFRNFARQSSDTRFGQVSVSAIAVRVVRLLHESARQARVTLRLKGIGRLPPASINETDLEQLFFALLENAIQAADGTQPRQVTVSGALKQEQIELRFCDSCGGIAPENRDRVFEPFFTTKPRGQGTGLGLCIVQDVVTRVGGRIRLESEPGKGTTFFVTLPVDKDATS